MLISQVAPGFFYTPRAFGCGRSEADPIQSRFAGPPKRRDWPHPKAQGCKKSWGPPNISSSNVFKVFKLENLGDYHDLYVQRDTLLLADVFNNFRDMCLKEYELDPAHFLSLPGVAWQACLKKTNIELELLTNFDMLLMVEEGIRGGICHSIHRYAKANNKYMKNYNDNEESSYTQHLDANNLYGWAISKKLPVNVFKWTDNNILNEEFIKNYNENDKKGYILEVDVKYPKKLHNLHSDLPFLPERMEINKCKKLVCNLYDKKNMLYT